MSGTTIQHKSSTLGELAMNAVSQNKRGRRVTATSSSRGGERGIRTPGPDFSGHGISSAAQSAALSSLRGVVDRPLCRRRTAARVSTGGDRSGLFLVFLFFSLGSVDFSFLGGAALGCLATFFGSLFSAAAAASFSTSCWATPSSRVLMASAALRQLRIALYAALS